jgi:hypothetical protein
MIDLKALDLELELRAEHEIEAVHHAQYVKGYCDGVAGGAEAEARRWFWRSIACLMVGAIAGIMLTLGFQEVGIGEQLLRELTR